MQNNKLLDRIAGLMMSDKEKYYKKININEENKRKIEALKNKYKDKRCFIVGSSPSLNLLDLTKLNNEYVFSVNRGYMLKDKGLKHTKFHVVSDRNTFEDENANTELLDGFADILFCYAGMKKPPVDIETFYFDYILGQLNKDIVFQNDLSKPLIAYQSVMHFAIQIAYYLGFSQIYLLGVDLDFVKNAGHAYTETDGEKQRQLEHSIKMAKTMLDGIEKCAKWLEANQVDLFNTSPCGIVDCIKRVKYEELF